MKKLLSGFFIIMTLCSRGLKADIVMPSSDEREAKELKVPEMAMIVVLSSMNDQKGKVSGRMRRKIRTRFKKSPMGPELRAIAYLQAKQKMKAAKK